jgi:predicted 3-demethylubiquinone-9 3-methyltransferase (glyoxalase superfamily)
MTSTLEKPMPSIVPCLWFADEAEEAANYYVGIFPNSRIRTITRYGTAGFEIHGRPAGSVLTVEFELDGQRYTALNGGPVFTFNEAVSLQVMCKDQAEVDYYWEKLGDGGDPNAQQCGWLKDRYGLSWQVAPEGMEEMLKDEHSAGAERAMAAMLQMKKIDIAEMRRAYAGQGQD